MYIFHNKYYFCSCSVIITILLNLMFVYAFNQFGEECEFNRQINRANCTGLQSYHPWPDSQTCNKYTVILPNENTYEPKALASFVTSGLAWFLQVIERSSGIVANDPTVYSRGLTPSSQIKCGSKVWSGQSIIQGNSDEAYGMLPMWYKKIMSYDVEDILDLPTLSTVIFNYRGVLLIRNPWHAIINSRPYIRNVLRKCTSCKNSPKFKQSEDFNHENFKIYFEDGARRWVKHVKKWILNSPHGSNMIIIRYENLIQNPEPEIRKVLNYLNITVDDDRLNCVLQDPADFIEHFPSHNMKSSISTFFEKNIDSKGTSILQNGMIEINQILHARHISENLDYNRPTGVDILTNSNAFFTRTLIV